MDVLVEWTNGTRNVVSKKELLVINDNEEIKEGTDVKMFYKKRWYSGTVIDYERSYSSDISVISDNDELDEIVPLAKMKRDFFQNKASAIQKDLIIDSCKEEEEEEELVDDPDEHSLSLFSGIENYDSFVDPNFSVRCKSKNCRNIGTGICACNMFMCEEHCTDHCDHKKSDSDSSTQENQRPRKKMKITKGKLKRTKLIENELLQTKVVNVHKTNDMPPEQSPYCESIHCKDEVFSACVRCYALLCFKHFDEDDLCSNHATVIVKATQSSSPAHFVMEGSSREEPRLKKKRENKQKVNKERRNTGKGYTQSNKSYNLVPPKCLKEKCKGEACKKQGKKCNDFTVDDRQKIFDAFYGMGNLTLQREYIGRFAVVEQKKRCLAKQESSRRQNTVKYSLPLSGIAVPVCKVFFINTLVVSEKSVRTSLAKIQETGVIETEKRGGRHASVIERDKQLRQAIIEHINKFDRVESHYVRSHTSKEYLHEDLSISKMYRMFCEENFSHTVASISTYAKVFNEMNLSFHRPKKDKCTLCTMFREGSELVKKDIEEKYNAHLKEKDKVREIKTECKNKSIQDKTEVAAVFDLQQVMYLPKSNESAIFYKRRLAVFNFTIYDLSTKDCHCYTWHETVSRRGASEISSCVFSLLMDYSKQNAKRVNLFCDGCAGQNKNTIVQLDFQ